VSWEHDPNIAKARAREERGGEYVKNLRAFQRNYFLFLKLRTKSMSELAKVAGLDRSHVTRLFYVLGIEPHAQSRRDKKKGDVGSAKAAGVVNVQVPRPGEAKGADARGHAPSQKEAA
jgi:AraC-like DNA-binding protein